ncbi:MAG: hypothetical protein ACOX77_08750, partial [Caldicoprobacterales bacterium]
MNVKFNQSNIIRPTIPQRQNEVEHKQDLDKGKPNDINHEIVDEYIPSKNQKEVVYTNHAKRYNAELIARLKRESEEAHSQLRELV